MQVQYFVVRQRVNCSLKDKVLVQSKFNTFADETTNITKMMILVLGTVENIVGKGENAGYQHFLFFPQYFQKGSDILTLSQTLNFRFSQSERVCRRQFQI